MIKQIIKFIFVGGTAFLIDTGILMILSKGIGINYMIANIFGFIISLIYNYILSVKFVFETKEKNKRKDFMQFVVLSLIGLLINEGIIYLCVHIFVFELLFSKILATGIVMIYNFITRKILLEK